MKSAGVGAKACVGKGKPPRRKRSQNVFVRARREYRRDCHPGLGVALLKMTSRHLHSAVIFYIFRDKNSKNKKFAKDKR